MAFQHKKKKNPNQTHEQCTITLEPFQSGRTNTQKRMKEVVSFSLARSLPGKISVHWDTGNQWICPQTAEGGADKIHSHGLELKCSLTKNKNKTFLVNKCPVVVCLLQQSLTVHPAVLGKSSHVHVSSQSERLQEDFRPVFIFHFITEKSDTEMLWMYSLFGEKSTLIDLNSGLK